MTVDQQAGRGADGAAHRPHPGQPGRGRAQDPVRWECRGDLVERRALDGAESRSHGPVRGAREVRRPAVRGMQAAVDIGIQFHAPGRLRAKEAMQAHAAAGSVELRYGGAQRTDRGREHRVAFQTLGRQAELRGYLQLACPLALSQRRQQLREYLGDLCGAVSERNLDRRDGTFAVGQFREHPGSTGASRDRREPADG